MPRPAAARWARLAAARSATKPASTTTRSTSSDRSMSHPPEGHSLPAALDRARSLLYSSSYPLWRKSMTKVFLAALCAFALVAGGCAHRSSSSGGTSSRSAGTVVDDAGLTAKVKTAIAKDVGAGTAANVNVTTYSGQVQ